MPSRLCRTFAGHDNAAFPRRVDDRGAAAAVTRDSPDMSAGKPGRGVFRDPVLATQNLAIGHGDLDLSIANALPNKLDFRSTKKLGDIVERINVGSIGEGRNDRREVDRK